MFITVQQLKQGQQQQTNAIQAGTDVRKTKKLRRTSQN